MYIDGDMIVVSIRAHQYKTAVTHDDDTIVVSIRAHQYKLALRRQVLRIGGTKNRAQQYKLALRQRVLKFENNKCYNNVHETDEDAL
jgi:hypothetical protein